MYTLCLIIYLNIDKKLLVTLSLNVLFETITWIAIKIILCIWTSKRALKGRNKFQRFSISEITDQILQDDLLKYL